MRSLPFYPMMVLLLVALGGYLGCDPNTVRTQLDRVQQGTASTATYNVSSIPDRTSTTILVGSFNIQRLGPSKLSKPWVMEKLAAVIRQFDVIALQEITSVDQRTLPELVDVVNSVGANYSYAISPRIGREALGYYEQYAFVYDASRIQSGPEFCYVVQDSEDLLHREPFVGRFQTRFPQQPFQFSLINIHTDPDEVSTELDVLASVFQSVRQYEYPQDDVLLLGDLNADPEDFRNLGRIPGLVPTIVGMPTNIRKNKTIDNILLDRQQTAEFTGRAGTIDLEEMFDIDFEKVATISDHLPVWAEFTAQEFTNGPTGATAAGASGVVR